MRIYQSRDDCNALYTLLGFPMGKSQSGIPTEKKRSGSLFLPAGLAVFPSEKLRGRVRIPGQKFVIFLSENPVVWQGISHSSPLLLRMTIAPFTSFFFTFTLQYPLILFNFSIDIFVHYIPKSDNCNCNKAFKKLNKKVVSKRQNLSVYG